MQKDSRSKNTQRARLAQAVCDLIVQQGDPAKVLELHYWSQEPGALECVRAIAAMPIQSRATLQAFLSSTDKGITASIEQDGALKVRSSRAAASLRLNLAAAASARLD